MPTRTFTPDQLTAIGVPSPYSAPKEQRAEHLFEEQIDTRRWVSVHHLVFRAPDDGKVWRVSYEQGLTENQDDHDPWNYEREVTAVEVEQRPTTVMEWHAIPDAPTAAAQQPAPLTPAELAQGQADADALAAEFPDTAASLLNELADDIPHRRAHAIAADYLARHRVIVLAEGADAINALPQDYECDPGRGDAAELLRRMAADSELATKQPADGAEIIRERDAQIIAWLMKKAREYRGNRTESAADAIARMADKISRGAVRPPIPAEQPTVPAVGDRYTSRHVSRTVTVTSVWTADDGHTAVSYEWRDDRPGQCGSACPLDVFHREYQLAEEQPAPPAPVYRFPSIAVPCPRCQAPIGQLCTSHSGTRVRRTDVHVARADAYQAQETSR